MFKGWWWQLWVWEKSTRENQSGSVSGQGWAKDWSRRERGGWKRERGRERFLWAVRGMKELHYQPISEQWFGGRREEGKGVSYCPRWGDEQVNTVIRRKAEPTFSLFFLSFSFCVFYLSHAHWSTVFNKEKKIKGICMCVCEMKNVIECCIRVWLIQETAFLGSTLLKLHDIYHNDM